MVEIRTACAHCGERLHITVDQDLRWKVRERGANPQLFIPHIDWSTFKRPNIIDDF